MSHRQSGKDDFWECDSCAAKPGTPSLCGGCIHNRDLVSRLKERTGILDLSLRDAKAWIFECYEAWAPGWAKAKMTTDKDRKGDPGDRLCRINEALDG